MTSRTATPAPEAMFTAPTVSLSSNATKRTGDIVDVPEVQDLEPR